MTAHPTRFGVNLVFAGTVAQTVEDAKRAADAGFDVVMVGDHLGSPAPLPTLVAVAAAVPSVRISTLVINAPLYQPALLARDLATVDAASGGRLEIALGSGYIAADFAGFWRKAKSHLRQIDHHAIGVCKGEGAHFDLAAELQDEAGLRLVTAETGVGRHRERIRRSRSAVRRRFRRPGSCDKKQRNDGPARGPKTHR